MGKTIVEMPVCFLCCRYKQCGCINPIIWDTRTLILSDTNNIIQAPLCNSLDPCFSNVADVYLNSSSDFDCPQECSMTDFTVEKSSLFTPVEWQMLWIKTFVEKSSITLPSDWSTAWREYIHTNYLAVSIVRETNVVENNTQTPSTSITDVLSNIGGQTGLWIGISLLSIMELVEMFYRLIRSAIRI